MGVTCKGASERQYWRSAVLQVNRVESHGPYGEYCGSEGTDRSREEVVQEMTHRVSASSCGANITG